MGKLECQHKHLGQPCHNYPRSRFPRRTECVACWYNYTPQPERDKLIVGRALEKAKAAGQDPAAVAADRIVGALRELGAKIDTLMAAVKARTKRPASLRLETDHEGVRRAVPEYS